MTSLLAPTKAGCVWYEYCAHRAVRKAEEPNTGVCCSPKPWAMRFGATYSNSATPACGYSQSATLLGSMVTSSTDN